MEKMSTFSLEIHKYLRRIRLCVCAPFLLNARAIQTATGGRIRRWTNLRDREALCSKAESLCG